MTIVMIALELMFSELEYINACSINIYRSVVWMFKCLLKEMH